MATEVVVTEATDPAAAPTGSEQPTASESTSDSGSSASGETQPVQPTEGDPSATSGSSSEAASTDASTTEPSDVQPSESPQPSPSGSSSEAASTDASATEATTKPSDAQPSESPQPSPSPAGETANGDASTTSGSATGSSDQAPTGTVSTGQEAAATDETSAVSEDSPTPEPTVADTNGGAGTSDTSVAASGGDAGGTSNSTGASQPVTPETGVETETSSASSTGAQAEVTAESSGTPTGSPGTQTATAVDAAGTASVGGGTDGDTQLQTDATLADTTGSGGAADGAVLDPASGAVAEISGLSQEEVVQVEAVLDAVAQVEGSPVSTDEITSDAIEGAAAAVSDGTALATTSDPTQLTDAIEEAIQVLEEASADVAPAPGTESLIPVAQSVDQGTVEQLFITDAGPSAALADVAEVLQASELASTTSEPVTAAVTIASTEQGTLVQVIQTSQFNPASPDPSGITYKPGSDRLFISDAEVDEMAIFQGVNLYEVTRTGTLTDTGVTTAYSREPTGLGFNPADGTLFVSDDDRDRITLVRPGADGRYGTADDQQVGSINVATFGLPVDAEGVDYDTNSGHVFIVDGAGNEVWRVDPGANGTFGDVDDVVSHFDVGQYGAVDPEGIGSVAARDNLVIVDNQSKAVYELTKSGELVRTVSLSALSTQPSPLRLAGLTLAPGTNDPNRMNLWIAARGVDNNANPNENDGRIFEIAWPSAPFINPPPSGPTILDIPIAAGRNDAEETSDGTVGLAQAALDLGRISSGPQTVGLRFSGVTLPSGATIVNVYVQFQARRTGSKATSLLITGEASDNSAIFTRTAFNISRRSRTAAAVQWSPSAWTAVGQAGPAQRTPDLSAILQEIVNRPGWASGNALTLILTGSSGNKRIAEAFEGVGPGPILHIEYVEAGGATVIAAVVSTTPEGPPMSRVVEDIARATGGVVVATSTQASNSKSQTGSAISTSKKSSRSYRMAPCTAKRAKAAGRSRRAQRRWVRQCWRRRAIGLRTRVSPAQHP